MKRRTVQILVFGLSCAVTGWVWYPFQTAARSSAPGRLAAPAVGSRVFNEDIHVVLRDLDSAESSEARLKAARRLDLVSMNQIRTTLDEIPLIDDGRLTLAAKLLLIRWAGEDGEATMNWAWKKFRSKGLWNDAFREIVAAWAWTQPAKLSEWAKRGAAARKQGLDEIPLNDAEQSDQPLLDFEGLNTISRCLVSMAPREAFEIFLIRGGYSSEDSKLPKSLQSVSAVQEALLAFDGLDRLQPDRWSGSEIHVNGLLVRWKELDPEDFKRSRFAHLIPDRP